MISSGHLATETKLLIEVERCALVTAAFVTYLGGCSEQTRTEVLKSFRQNYNIQDFSPVTFCATETEQVSLTNHEAGNFSVSVALDAISPQDDESLATHLFS